MLFDDLEVDSINHNGSLYVNVPQLATHLAKAVRDFAHESSQLANIFPLDIRERAFIIGLIEGMENVVVMLKQANDEHSIGSIDTIDELLERFRDASI